MRDRNRRAARDTVLDAAERLLRTGASADFSMRGLAAEAGVGFATPFNHFGNKTEIMRALSARLIDRMADGFRARCGGANAVDRALTMGDVAVELLLQRPDVHRAVVGSLSVASPTPGAVMPHSRSLWAMALDGEDAGFSPDARPAAPQLAEQLALAFRGCLSFWVAGEIADQALRATVRRTIATTLLGFVATEGQRARLLAILASARPD